VRRPRSLGEQLAAIESRLRRAIASASVPASERDDVCQDVLLRLHRTYGTGRRELNGNLNAVLGRTIRNTLIRRAESARERASVAMSIEPEDDVGNGRTDPPIDEHLAELDMWTDVVPIALGALTAQERHVLDLRFCHELTNRDTARALGVTPGFVTQREQRGLGKLACGLGRCLPATGEHDDERLLLFRYACEEHLTARRLSLEMAEPLTPLERRRAQALIDRSTTARQLLDALAERLRALRVA
jgi:RNA polymerase sigma factor (sigma-70 family)